MDSPLHRVTQSGLGGLGPNQAKGAQKETDAQAGKWKDAQIVSQLQAAEIIPSLISYSITSISYSTCLALLKHILIKYKYQITWLYKTTFRNYL